MSAEDERVAKYAHAIYDDQIVSYDPDEVADVTAAVMDVADAEQEALRAEVKRLRDGLSEVNADIHSLERDLAVERARVARVALIRDAIAEQCQHDEHGVICEAHQADLYGGTCALLLDMDAALADPDAQNGSGRPVTPAPSTDTSEGSQGRTEAHSTPNEANRGRRTKETT